MSSHCPMNKSLTALLSEIVDYAGLFPPSEVSMQVAVQNFNSYIRGEHAWMLGRFVVPVGRLEEFSESSKKYLEGKNLWRLSALPQEDLAASMAAISEFNEKNAGRAVIDTVEVKVSESREITTTGKILPTGVIAFYEIPATEILTDFITALALTRQRAKIRTGGITPGAFPSTDAVIKFMRICIAANVPFKATAGLHHPLRCQKPLTYEPNAPTGTMHGFLNLFLAACLLRHDLNHPLVHRLMNESDDAAFQFDDEAIRWAGHEFPTKAIELTRLKNAVSFGSCSFVEPIEDLGTFKI